MSCEEAAEKYNSDLIFGSSSLPRDMTGSAYGALLQGTQTFSRLQRCATGKPRLVNLCVAIRGFRAVGVTATASPDDRTTEQCLVRAISELRFSHQPTLQLLRTNLTLWPNRRH